MGCQKVVSKMSILIFQKQDLRRSSVFRMSVLADWLFLSCAWSTVLWLTG